MLSAAVAAVGESRGLIGGIVVTLSSFGLRGFLRSGWWGSDNRGFTVLCGISYKRFGVLQGKRLRSIGVEPGRRDTSSTAARRA